MYLLLFTLIRCTNDEDKHMVYIAEKTSDFPSDDAPTTEMTGDNNVVVFAEIGFEVSTGTAYKWRVDCVEGGSGNRRGGDIWEFSMK